MPAGVDTSHYEEIWQAFLQGDHISAGAIWGGKGLALVIPLPADVTRRMQALQEQLAARLRFEAHCPEVLHITLHLFGDLPPERQADLLPFLHEWAARWAAFSIRLRRINSFFRAPFVEVWDNGIIGQRVAALRQDAVERGFAVLDYGPRGQVFHVTLGAYSESSDGAAARMLLQELRSFEAGEMEVNEIHLVETSAGKPYRMEIIERYRLANPINH